MEPRALKFDDTPAPKRERSHAAAREPGALVFGTSPAAEQPPTSRPAGAPNSAATRAPAPVAFPPTSVPRPVSPAFAQQKHPLTATALTRAAEIAPALAHQEAERVERAIARLLPLTLAGCEEWGNKTMEDCRQLAQKCASVTAQFNHLDSGQKLEQVFKAAVPANNTLEKLRRKLAGLSVTDQEARVVFIRKALEQLLKDVRQLRPEVAKDGLRLAVKALTFRAVADVTGVPADPTFETVIERRRRLLLAALQQAELLSPQLQTLEQTAALQLSQCDQLLHVTLPLLAQQASKS